MKLIIASNNKGKIQEYKDIFEPYPTEELVRKYPDYYDLYHKPDFLFVKSVK